MFSATVYLLLTTIAGFAYASSPSLVPTIPLPGEGLVRAYPDLFTWVLALAILCLLGLVAIMLRHNVKNNEKQWDKIDNHEGRLQPLEVSHAILMREHDRFTEGGRCTLCGNKPHRRETDEPCRDYGGKK